MHFQYPEDHHEGKSISHRTAHGTDLKTIQTFLMLVGILLALLGAAAASPTGTPTTPEGATGVVLGPRRNGFNDLPSDSLSYNRAQEWNAIPDWAMASDPENGHDAIIYTREEIYTAMQVGAIYKTEPPGFGANPVCCLVIARL